MADGGRGTRGGKSLIDLVVDSILLLARTGSGGAKDGEAVISSARETGVLGLVVEHALSTSELAEGDGSTVVHMLFTPCFTWPRSW